MKGATGFVKAPAAASIGIRAGAPNDGVGAASVGAGITLSAMSFGAAVDVLKTPFTLTTAPCACAEARAGVNVMPVPAAPAVPTVVIVTVWGLAPAASTVSVFPATMPVTEAT